MEMCLFSPQARSKLVGVLQNVITQEALDASHVQARRKRVAVAALHAEMGADAAGDGGAWG